MKAADSPATHDFYTGFEGEPEIVIEHVIDGKQISVVYAWIGYFDRVMGLIPPGPSGWSGVALHYHLLTAWESEPRWIDPDIRDTISKMEAARDLCADPTVGLFVDAVVSLLRDAQSQGGEVAFSRE